MMTIRTPAAPAAAAARPCASSRSRFVGSPGIGTAARASPAARSVIRTMAIFGKKKAAKEVLPTIIPGPDYRLAGTVGALAAGLAGTGHPFGAALPAVIATFFAIQANNVKFVFGPEHLEVKVGSDVSDMRESDNKIVGGANKWRYDTFTNWEMWWPGFPILVYFKETQTKPEGQIHFFPVLFDGKVIYDTMVERCGPSMNSGPKGEEE
mmetsp:Transcript_45737/g.145733  ORF Transcript_45737/g.145733 Transcript_45737/m.145733 type:complete len:209 (+) Transcript_45737:18-644(+)